MKVSACLFLIVACSICKAQIADSVFQVTFAPFTINSETKTSGGKNFLVVHIAKEGATIFSDSVVTNVNTCTGFSLPAKQPFAGYFIFCKREKNNGKTYILSATGDLHVIAGGSFWAAPRNQLLFILAERDYTNLLIYDLKQRKIVLEKFNCDEFNGWYYKRGKYMGQVLAECGEEEKDNEVSGILRMFEVEQFDVKPATLNEVHVSEEDLEHAKKLVRYATCK